jgi:hypothetical protein
MSATLSEESLDEVRKAAAEFSAFGTCVTHVAPEGVKHIPLKEIVQMNIREECDGCPFHIPASAGCTKIAHGLKCEYEIFPPLIEEVFKRMSARGHTSDEASRSEETRALIEKLSASALEKQVGGDHYKGLGAYQPWLIMKATFTPEEFRGYMKGTALAYLLRDGKKGDDDLGKAAHTLEGFIELAKGTSSR